MRARQRQWVVRVGGQRGFCLRGCGGAGGAGRAGLRRRCCTPPPACRGPLARTHVEEGTLVHVRDYAQRDALDVPFCHRVAPPHRVELRPGGWDGGGWAEGACTHP